MLGFMEQFDPVQIRYSGNELRTLIEWTYDRAIQLQQVRRMTFLRWQSLTSVSLLPPYNQSERPFSV